MRAYRGKRVRAGDWYVCACNTSLLMKLPNDMSAIICAESEKERGQEKERGAESANRGARDVIYDGTRACVCVCVLSRLHTGVECALFMAEKNGRSIKARGIEIRRSFMRARQWSTD